MCGIVAVVRARTGRQTPSTTEILELLDSANQIMPTSGSLNLDDSLAEVAIKLTEANNLLKGEAGVRALIENPKLSDQIFLRLEKIFSNVVSIDNYLEEQGDLVPDLESINAALIEVKDVLWSIKSDRLRCFGEILELSAEEVNTNAIPWLFSIQQTLSNIDRLEVRGRDSAGIHILVSDHGMDLDSEDIKDQIAKRISDPLFNSGSVRLVDGKIGFVYKAAAEIGELGDNTSHIRKTIRTDTLLHKCLAGENSTAVVLAHTRWASVGIISEPNAHPINSDELIADQGPYVTAVLNGDVDNFADIKSSESLQIANEITTDTKVIPTVVSRNISKGLDLDEAVRNAVSQFEGSVAIGISTAMDPEGLHLALRGSGQGVYIGLAEDAFIIASEPYGVVEDATSYLRMDGETPSNPNNPASQGQIIRLDGSKAGQVEGVRRTSYDGSEIAVDIQEWQKPAVTTRDIDLGDNPHFLLKEISESPVSFAKTLRGRLIEKDGKLVVKLPSETIDEGLAKVIGSGIIKQVKVIGQGTAAVAGQAIASSIAHYLADTDITVQAITATELSGFNTTDDMSDTLIIAVSQSGTTTDTNRTVDVVRSRGSKVIAIVNRRGSDLSDKADGVLYTSDGRDVEMSVASTKAFYAQIAAGFLLADGLAQLLPDVSLNGDRQELLKSLRDLPEAMNSTLELRGVIGDAATAHAPSRRYWAIVGNGSNKVAAEEIRIKLSELCYKAIPCDVTEDKKHIDLSSEPLILVCAAGLEGSNADDVAKEVAIFKAHKAAPIVIANEGESRFSSALEVISVPVTHTKLAFILSTMVGHLFGYEAALAIDASARPLREARGEIENFVGDLNPTWFKDFNKAVNPYANTFFDGLRNGSYNGHLEASTANKVATLLRFASGVLPLDIYQSEFGKVGTPGTVVESLALALTEAIEELTRPIDAIKHQAKTVTVGISRADESLLQSELTKSVLGTGCPRDRMSYKTLRTLSAVSPAVKSVNGYTRYRIDGNPEDSAQIFVVDKGGIALDMTSRAEKDPTLRGTKHRVSVERMPIVTVGTDSRVVLIVPEVKDNETTGLTLCHLTLEEKLNADTARSVLQGYRNRYRQLVDVVTESDPNFRDDIFTDVPTVDLLTAPISEVADHWT